jgi:L-lactate dehydrogenase complex protein LldF
MTDFVEISKVKLRDEQLRANLFKATHTIRDKRARVVAEVPEWEELREAGRAIKAETLARLPELLEQFEAAAKRAGAKVHWARDAREAGEIVAGIIRATGAGEAVKVKSMATQEIQLNETLEAQGIHALETDRPS